MKQKIGNLLKSTVLIAVGCAVFAAGFDLFLAPNDLNIGGLSGIGMILTEILGMGSIGLYTAVLNVPLFLLGWRVIGRKFFLGSLVGVALSSFLLDFFSFLPPLHTELLLDCIYGGLATGVGLGLVLLAEASTGGTDILARVMKRRFRDAQLGKVMMAVDIVIVILTGVVFRDYSRALYSAIPLFVSSFMIDAVIYGLDYSAVAYVISDRYETVSAAVQEKLNRGVTLLDAAGGYTGEPKKVLMTAVRRRQVPELKDIVKQADPSAFMILQEAHQVLGEGFKRYEDEL